jgi:putative acetyltransferase
MRMPRVREERARDSDAVRMLIARAFGREAEARLVGRLRASGKARLALVAEDAGRLIGHVLFSEVSVAADCPVLALAPLSVLPAFQRLGVGSALVSDGLDRLRGGRISAVLVLGDPRYYSRFGFAPASQFGIECPFPAPPEAFMALELTPGALAGPGGMARYGHEFDDLE